MADSRTWHEPRADPRAQPRSTTTLGQWLRWTVGTVSLGAAGLHFAFIADHFDEYWLHGAFFAVVAWLQLIFALEVIFRPSRAVLWFGIALNAFVIGTWIVSRTVGVPVGPTAGDAESVALVDSLASAFELVAIVGSCLLLRPAIAAKRVPATANVPMFATLGVAVVGMATLSLTPAFASGHSHGDEGHDDGGHGAETVAADGSVTMPDGTVHTGDEHAEVTGEGDGHAHDDGAMTIAADGTSPCEQSGPPVSEGQTGSHGHRGPTGWTPITDASEQAVYEQELAISYTAAAAYQTKDSAQAAGYFPVTGDLPCIGEHWIKFSIMDSTFDPAEPEMLLFHNDTMVGLSYYVVSTDEPAGFTGPNDGWHRHLGLCIKGARVVGPESWTEEQCTAAGGVKADGSNGWMMHAWVVPGWESWWGLFSGEHPGIGVRSV